MSCARRDFLRVEFLIEKFRENGVRFITITDNVDSCNGTDDFAPFRNIINEWQARDTSRKIKAIFGARTTNGNHVTGAVPYGYIHDPNDHAREIERRYYAKKKAARLAIEEAERTKVLGGGYFL